jgi:hypothetical protein
MVRHRTRGGTLISPRRATGQNGQNPRGRNSDQSQADHGGQGALRTGPVPKRLIRTRILVDGVCSSAHGPGGRHAERVPAIANLGGLGGLCKPSLELQRPWRPSASERLQAGEDSAHAELLDCANDRLTRLARNMVRGYPGVVRWEQAEGVLTECTNPARSRDPGGRSSTSRTGAGTPTWRASGTRTRSRPSPRWSAWHGGHSGQVPTRSAPGRTGWQPIRGRTPP